MRRTLPAAVVLGLALALAGCASAGAPAASTPPAASAADPTSAADASANVTVTISGGLETNPVDSGRPVVLVAGALGVPEEVFQEAFSGVTPAEGGQEPDPEQVQRNKAALLAVLAPYGVTNESLDAASNRYRYLASVGETWPHTEASAIATVVDGVVTGVEIVSSGSGYTSAPTVTLSNGQTATAELHFGTDIATNGSISAIALD